MENVRSITAEELHRKMEAGNVFILDVRNEEEYNDWKIEGKKTQSVNIPYFAFLDEMDEEDEILSNLPKDKEIAVVCAKGGASDYVAQMLNEKGYTSSSLKDGMLAWSQYYHPVTVYADEKLKIIQINRLAKGCLSYAVISAGKGMIVDPSKDTDVYIELAQKHQFTIEHVVDSHLHADHITGGPRLAEQVGAPYYLSSEEAKGTNLKFEPLEQYGRIKVGDIDVEVLSIPTPGHTPGSTSFLIDNRFLLSGDTIFVGGLGRPDLGGKAKEWAEDLYHTVFYKLKDLPDDCLVLPGHYSDIREMNDSGVVAERLGKIRENNEIMRNEDKASFTEQVASAVSMEKPPNFEEIVAINRGELKVDANRAIELEIGPNRCAVHHHGIHG